jgi:hypothetical protein
MSSWVRQAATTNARPRTFHRTRSFFQSAWRSHVRTAYAPSSATTPAAATSLSSQVSRARGRESDALRGTAGATTAVRPTAPAMQRAKPRPSSRQNPMDGKYRIRSATSKPTMNRMCEAGMYGSTSSAMHVTYIAVLEGSPRSSSMRARAPWSARYAMSTGASAVA